MQEQASFSHHNCNADFPFDIRDNAIVAARAGSIPDEVATELPHKKIDS